MLTAVPTMDAATPGLLAEAAGQHRRQADSLGGYVSFVEPDESFLSLSIRNFGLTLATLGFYNFWARAEARQKLHRSLRIGGQPLDYSGTGREAFVAFLISTVMTVAIVSAFLYFFRSTGTTGGQVKQTFDQFRFQRLFITLPMLFLLGSVVYRKRKELLRRTWWRGQHFDLTGQPYSYAMQHFWTAFLVPATLGWAGPWRASQLERRKIKEMSLGDERFEAVGGLRQLYKAFAALWFGGGMLYVGTMAIVGLTVGDEVLTAIKLMSLAPLTKPGVLNTLMMVLACGLVPFYCFVLYYRAAWLEHQISSLVVSGRRLDVQLPKAKFAGLILWNAFVKIISFGAFAPVADATLVRFVVARITTRPWLGVPTG